MSNEEKSFREKLGNDIKTVQRMLYVEEVKSFIAAIGFAVNAACLVMLPFTPLSVLCIFAVWFCAKQFKPTIKKQIAFHEHLKLLRTIKKEKVWTHSDEK